MTHVHYTVHYWVGMVYLGESIYTGVLGGAVLVSVCLVYLVVQFWCTYGELMYKWTIALVQYRGSPYMSGVLVN